MYCVYSMVHHRRCNIHVNHQHHKYVTVLHQTHICWSKPCACSAKAAMLVSDVLVMLYSYAIAATRLTGCSAGSPHVGERWFADTLDHSQAANRIRTFRHLKSSRCRSCEHCGKSPNGRTCMLLENHLEEMAVFTISISTAQNVWNLRLWSKVGPKHFVADAI